MDASMRTADALNVRWFGALESSCYLFFSVESPCTMFLSLVFDKGIPIVLESGILPSAFHFASITLVCCLSCCPLSCGSQERKLCSRWRSTTSRWYIGGACSQRRRTRQKCLVLFSQVSGGQSSATFPWGFRPHTIDQEAHALVVGRIQPEHTIENAPSLIETAEAP